MFLRVRPSSCCPHTSLYGARYAHLRICAGAAQPHEASGARGPAERYAVAARAPLLSARPKGRGIVNFVQNLHMYIYTTFDERTTKRRAGSPAARQLSEFSTALAGGRGAASASTASRSRAPRGGSSAPPVWSRCSSACPTRVPSAPLRSLRTVSVSRGASWLGRALVACDGLRGRN